MLYRAASSVDSITDYNEFSLRRFFDIYFSVLQAECSLMEVLK